MAVLDKTSILSAVHKQLQENRAICTAIEDQLSVRIAEFVAAVAAALDGHRKILVMGNGGSAADAQHLAAELVGRFRVERPGLPAIALTTDTSILTAVGNDYGFEVVFARQVEALAQAGDVVIGLSTSGQSPNVLAGLQAARQAGCVTIALLGRDGGTIAAQADHALIIPAFDTARIQEGHLLLIHILCDLLDTHYGGPGSCRDEGMT